MRSLYLHVSGILVVAFVMNLTDICSGAETDKEFVIYTGAGVVTPLGSFDQKAATSTMLTAGLSSKKKKRWGYEICGRYSIKARYGKLFSRNIDPNDPRDITELSEVRSNVVAIDAGPAYYRNVWNSMILLNLSPGMFMYRSKIRISGMVDMEYFEEDRWSRKYNAYMCIGMTIQKMLSKHACALRMKYYRGGYDLNMFSAVLTYGFRVK